MKYRKKPIEVEIIHSKVASPPVKFCQYEGYYKLLEYFKCLLGFHYWHRFSKNKDNIFAFNSDGTKSKFCRHCGIIYHTRQWNEQTHKSMEIVPSTK